MSLLPPKVTLMSVSTSNTYMKLQNFRKLDKNAKLPKKRTLPISGQNLFPQWCPLIRDYTVLTFLLPNFLNPYCGLEQLFLMKTLSIVHTKRYGGFPNYSP